MSNDSLKARTTLALGDKVMQNIENKVFCILGCGAVGSLFAEMLVRSGATRLNLVDGDKVELSNLNRCFAFSLEDIGKNKACALAERLKTINPNVNARVCEEFFKKKYGADEPKSHPLIRGASVVIVAMDTNQSRIDYEEMSNQESLSIGVHVGGNGDASYEVLWNPKTPKCLAHEEGYGDNGSYASIVVEATAAGFGMLLAHLNNSQFAHKKLYREFKCFVPNIFREEAEAK